MADHLQGYIDAQDARVQQLVQSLLAIQRTALPILQRVHSAGADIGWPAVQTALEAHAVGTTDEMRTIYRAFRTACLAVDPTLSPVDDLPDVPG